MTGKPFSINNLGYPRIGARRELKKATERYWKQESTEEELAATAARLRRHHWELQKNAGVDLIPCNDFSLYDQVLDMTCLLGNIPSRFGHTGGDVPLELYFRMARGKSGEGSHGESCCQSSSELACEMTKWFDTNYHYLVPEFNESSRFAISSSKIFDECEEAGELGIDIKPVLIGPLTYLTLGKEIGAKPGFDRFSLADSLTTVYVDILRKLANLGVSSVQIDEPALVLDLNEDQREIVRRAFNQFEEQVPEITIQVTTYFGELQENRKLLTSLPVAGIHFDAIRGAEELDALLEDLSNNGQTLSLGVVDGRNVWKTSLKQSLKTLQKAASKLGEDRIQIAPSCSLLHVPVSLAEEADLDPEIKSWLAFANEKLDELNILQQALQNPDRPGEAILQNEKDIQSRRSSARVHVAAVQARASALSDDCFRRNSPFSVRQAIQSAKLKLPIYPTTTIGSFPQTDAVRKARASFRNGKWSKEQYDTFLRLRTSDCIQMQDRAGLDVLVHGEFERNDMVEYFGEQLDGFVFTRFGWVQSYGTRCVKPPIIFGDVSRPAPMTVEWAKFAQSQTTKPMKGMLTGPVTILQWSFVRDDQPRRETAFQIGLAIRDEVADLEAAGLPIVQIDEAAIREGLPLRKSEWADYFDWTGKAFRLSAGSAGDGTQIHTHMCYSEFNDMLPAIIDLDADVITIENARSGLELLDAFRETAYPYEIGPGVYDIHSPRLPTIEEMVQLLDRASEVIPEDHLWVNPDCGLKTRAWEDVEPALKRMVAAAVRKRESSAVPA